MKRVLILAVLISICLFAKSQSNKYHGIGLHIGFGSDSKKSISPEYEFSKLHISTKGYAEGVIAGAGFSLPIKDNDVIDDRKFAVYAKGGYKLMNLSIGGNLGVKKESKPRSSDPNYSDANLLYGAWAAINIVRPLKISVGGDNFNGFKLGLIFYPNTVSSNNR